MLELKYLALLLCLSVVGALAGLAAHFWRSEVGNGTGADEDPVYERGALVGPDEIDVVAAGPVHGRTSPEPQHNEAPAER